MKCIHPVWVLVLCVAAVGIALWTLPPLFPISHPVKRGNRLDRLANIDHIRQILREYDQEMGSRPNRLSDLVPNFIHSNRLEIFWEPSATINSLPDQGKMKTLQGIDTNSVYIYSRIGRGSRRIILFERPGIWRTGLDRWMDSSVYAVDEDFNLFLCPTQSLNVSEF